ncbi:actin-related protein [Pholiota conissans]|uniref:Actin-related protein n=1 Tax=Pholiota conissans TaxID=109636 RepID=A0A9P6CW61_9AGAR|nr:actin-related protein [Pholiota conissans]
MPRGIPNAKRDETGMKYTMFNVPLAFNPKHASSNYLKSESQTLWARNAQRKSKAPQIEEATPEQRRGSQIIVIHPGSRYIRIGKASDVNPISVPSVVARRAKLPFSVSKRTRLVSYPLDQMGGESSLTEDADVILQDDPFNAKLSSITVSLRDRMRFYKLRVTPNATKIASTFNEQFKPERIAEHNDYQTEWIDSSCPDDILVGEKALRIVDPVTANYMVRWPIYGSNFNTRDYTSLQMILSDLEALVSSTLSEKFNIGKVDYKNYSIALVIPDFYDRAYVRELVNLFIVHMGFKQICAQQESLAATYGAGISNACVVDIGAVKTSIACVDEGLVLPDTRMTLNMGGDDITEFLYVLLNRIKFPYREIDLNNTYDWNVMEDLKSRLCTLADSDVALNLYDFNVRRPGKLTEKYGLRAYDEIIMAPMCLFEPRVIEFDKKRERFNPLSQNVTEEITGHQSDHVTNAMIISTQHLLPARQPPPEVNFTPTQQGSENAPPTEASSPMKPDADVQAMDVDNVNSAPSQADTTPDAPIEVIDVEDDNKPTVNSQPQPAPPAVQAQSSAAASSAGGYDIDIYFEASKLPMDVAIFNSARAAGGDEKIRKYLQAVLVIGGTALIPGMAHALESRLQAIATPLVPNMEKVQIIPPPKEVDPRVLAWKGAAVLGKMDSVSELWVTPSDWEIFGMRALKERCFYL